MRYSHMPDLDKIMAYENGELDNDESIALFQSMLDDGSVWQLQGHYGRTAVAMLEQGLIAKTEHRERVAFGAQVRTDLEDRRI